MSKLAPVDKAVAQTKIKDGSKLIIWDCYNLAMSPVASFYMRHMAKLIDDGHAQQIFTGGNNSSAVYATLDGKVVGAIVYEIHSNQRMAYILLSCVDEEHRGKGIYTALHPYFEEVAVAQGCNRIGSIVHVDNAVRLASCAKVGMVPEFTRMVKLL
jgi:GNAT superfamily N-acetyltransferase